MTIIIVTNFPIGKNRAEATNNYEFNRTCRGTKNPTTHRLPVPSIFFFSFFLLALGKIFRRWGQRRGRRGPVLHHEGGGQAERQVDVQVAVQDPYALYKTQITLSDQPVIFN